VFVYHGAVVPGQRSLFASGDPAVDPGARWERIELGDGSWVDVVRGHLRGADAVLDELVATVPWRSSRRHMYDRVVDDPRLSYRYQPGEPIPHPELARVREQLIDRYHVPFGELALNLYRDGRDSVAFHRDRELRELDDTLVAILTLGARRPFRIRPFGTAGTRSRDLAPDSGDLLVMGGTCQREWEHGVPKVTSAGPRVSAMWRWSNPLGAAEADAG
jgi:alkylated DNA repair dioxygenase AlkB